MAWTAPVVAVSATAPAFAASPVVCPVVPVGGSWTPTTFSGTLASKADGYGWDNNGSWVIYRDNGSQTQSLVFTSSSPAIPATPLATYQGSFSYYWGYGNGQSGQSSQGTFEILVNNVVVKTVSRPGNPLTTSSQTVTYTVPAQTTSIVVTYRYTLAAQGTSPTRPASDDLTVGRLMFTTCTVN